MIIIIYITGDIHGNFSRFNTQNFPQQKKMNKNDYVIICGDFGGIWANTLTKEEEHWLNWLNSKPFTTLFIDGNHENFDRLNKYPIDNWNGGKVHFIKSSIIHLMRSQLYNINGLSFFTIGGAKSHDIEDGILNPNDTNKIKKFKRLNKSFRINHVSWWKEETPNLQEIENAKSILKENKNIDYIITHSPPSSINNFLSFDNDYFSNFLEEIKNNIDYKHWFCGHIHLDKVFYYENITSVYRKFLRIE